MNYLKTKYRIKNIEVDNYDFQKLIPQVNYMDLWKELRLFNPDIPTEKECRENDYWIARNDCNVIITLKNGIKLSYTIKKGLVTDLASVPRLLRGVIDNNSNKIILAAIIHDVNFACHILDFEASNILLENMCKYYRMNYFKRKSVYFAVKFFGKSHYKATPEQIKLNSKFTDFKWRKK
jgi:hypothetical protein